MIDSVEEARLKNLCLFETRAYSQGYSLIAGVDEAGRGPLAGPVVAAACILPRKLLIEGINDSKQLSEATRNSIFQYLFSLKDVYIGIGIIEPSIIDQINILQATFKAMVLAVAQLNIQPDYLLIDGNQKPPVSIPTQMIVKGDSLSQSIAAASIVAKVTRDRLMQGYHDQWPQYGFKKHKGYGTKEHLLALKEHGPCPIHRVSFKVKGASYATHSV